MATTKLTLSADKQTVALAKRIAANSKISVSKLFKIMIKEREKDEEKAVSLKPLDQYPEWMQQLIVAKEPTPDFDHKAEYHKHLDEKYGL